VREEKVNDGYYESSCLGRGLCKDIRWLFSMMTSMTKLESSMGRIGLAGLD
jgi:hypothetical protein